MLCHGLLVPPKLDDSEHQTPCLSFPFHCVYLSHLLLSQYKSLSSFNSVTTQVLGFPNCIIPTNCLSSQLIPSFVPLLSSASLVFV